MDQDQLHMMRSYLANAQLQLYAVHHVKLGPDWDYHLKDPEVNRLYYFMEGAGKVRIRSREYSPRPGQLFLLPAHVEQAFFTDKENTFRKYFCHFTLTIGEIHFFQLFHIPCFIEVPDREWLEARFLKLIELSQSQSLTSPLQIKSVLYEILTQFLDQALLHENEGDWGIEAVTPAMTKINTIVSYIEANLAEKMNINELAGRLHFHPNYFIQLFKSTMGVSPIAYITRKRMEKAQLLLATSDLTVTEIADAVGMGLYHFSSTFRKLMSLSPSEYRRYLKSK
ncbi:helix-turn-helix transcriptional regulator [Paenibacillus spongiae]|uniref:AraC family transcriptional regulator n=1 Tax=Paenibacillus spongiae TaxID=2909671 RepID=A0ABY5S9Z6_9BACL|nr:AraC family transcriptional regulator [Paenibacillus spongiae]UVI30752.1 AraC family transcriptional regulator [Paenibacillus spongiae]